MKKNLFSLLVLLFSTTYANAEFFINMGKTVSVSGTLENETLYKNDSKTTTTHDIESEGVYMKIGYKSGKMQNSLIVQGFEITSDTGNIDNSDSSIKSIDLSSLGYEFKYGFMEGRFTPFAKVGVDIGEHDLSNSSKYQDNNDTRYELGFNIGVGVQTKITDYLFLDIGINNRVAAMQEIELSGHATIDKYSSSYDLQFVNIGLTLLY